MEGDSVMNKKGYMIGEVSKITGITRETLRHYDKLGIISPSYVDPETNYRYYTYDQFWCFDIIVVCRSLGISLDKIKAILNTHNNEKVVELLAEERVKAESLSRMYARIAEDISWYASQQDLMHDTDLTESVVIKHLPERKVLMGANQEERRAYHIALQKQCMLLGKQLNTLRRGYGFVLDSAGIQSDNFLKVREFIQFQNDEYEKIPEEHLTVIPEGDYACIIHDVVGVSADFSVLRNWLRETGRTGSLLISDEIGIQLFPYMDRGSVCESKLLLD